MGRSELIPRRGKVGITAGREVALARGRKLPRVLNVAEQRALLRQFDRRYPSGLRNLLLVRLMLECGLRSGEVVALRPEHLDLSTCLLYTSDAADDLLCVDLGGRRIIK